MPGSTVSTVAELNAAIKAADALGTGAGAYTITLSSDISLGGTALEAINLKTGVTLDIVGTNGASSYALIGDGTDRGLFVYAGTVSIQNLLIENMKAVGGAGGAAAGGGAGLGGGLFIGSNVAGDAGSVTLTNVSFTGNTATGGAGGDGRPLSRFSGGGGGGGLGGNGGSPAEGNVNGNAAGGGGIGVAATGGNSSGNQFHHPGGNGIVPGAAGGGMGGSTSGDEPPGASGGGGGASNNGTSSGGGGGGVGGGGANTNGGGGGYGGGGGGGAGQFEGIGGMGGFGGGAGAGAGDQGTTQQGGFGGGGSDLGGLGGFGGGNGGPANVNGGGGGLAAGGDIFVQAGAALTIIASSTTTTANGAVTGGAAGPSGQAGQTFGAGIYLQGTNTLTLSNGGGTATIAAAIADDTGAATAASYGGASGYTEGSVGVTVTGGGTLILSGTNTYTGGTTLTSGILEITSAANIGSGAVVFGGATLQIDTAPVSGSTFSNVLTSFDLGDRINLHSVAYAPGAMVSLSGTTLTLTDGAYTQSFILSAAPAAGTQFFVGADSVAGTDISAACYCPGTLILTERGEVAIEALAIGDMVETLSSGLQPIRWVGRRSYAGAFIGGNHLMLPVTIKAGALEPGVPARDLHVSPGHAIYLDGVLVPAWRLVNGVSVTQAAAVEAVTYLHIDLAEHEVIFAGGCPAESFIDDDCRHQFHNAATYPGAADETRTMCATRVEDGPHLQAIQRRVAARAGLLSRVPVPGALHGFVDQAGPVTISGWAQDLANPEDAVWLDILAGGRRVARVLANRYRADLRQAGLGSGTHAFEIRLPAACAGPIEVRRAVDGVSLALTDAAQLGLAA